MRAIADIRVGILTIKEKWELFLKQNLSILSDPELQDLYPLTLEEDNLYIAANIIPSLNLVNAILNLPVDSALFGPNDDLIAVRTKSSDFKNHLNRFKTTLFSDSYTSIKEKHEIFLINANEIVSDFKLITNQRNSAPLINPANRFSFLLL